MSREDDQQEEASVCLGFSTWGRLDWSHLKWLVLAFFISRMIIALLFPTPIYVLSSVPVRRLRPIRPCIHKRPGRWWQQYYTALRERRDEVVWWQSDRWRRGRALYPLRAYRYRTRTGGRRLFISSRMQVQHVQVQL
jgi:hypothetical protein